MHFLKLIVLPFVFATLALAQNNNDDNTSATTTLGSSTRMSSSVSLPDFDQPINHLTELTNISQQRNDVCYALCDL